MIYARLISTKVEKPGFVQKHDISLSFPYSGPAAIEIETEFRYCCYKPRNPYFLYFFDFCLLRRKPLCLKVWTLAIALLMSQTEERQRFTISKVAAD